MDLMGLVTRLAVDTSEFDRGLTDARQSVGSFAEDLRSGLETATKVIGAGIAMAAAGVASLTQDAMDAYADYEQLSGGVETLFKDSADAVKAHASEAYRTAGLSANEYMETVTSISAALIQATGRGKQKDIEALEASLDERYKKTKRSLEDEYDEIKRHWDKRIKGTKDGAKKASLQEERDAELKALKRHNEDKLQALKETHKQQIAAAEAANQQSTTSAESLSRAAELADQAIIDMSDNANKMGTDMASIQAAYQGFSKANYTMLDNLKLGYGGTKAEMERLLANAEKLTGKKFDLSSYADIVEAIHAIQTEMGITGTTAMEASATIEGSIGAMESAWKNLVTGMADENANLDKLMDDFVESVAIAADNVLPRIEQALMGIGDLVTKLGPIMAERLPGLMEQLLPPLVAAAATLFMAFAGTVPSLIEPVGEAILDSVDIVGDAIADKVPALGLIFDNLSGIITGAATAFAAYKGVVLLSTLATEGATIAQAGLNAVMSANPVGLVVAAVAGLVAIVVRLWDTNEDFRAAMTDIWDGIKATVEGFVSFFGGIVDTFAEATKLNSLPDAIEFIFLSARLGIEHIFEPLVSFFEGIWDAVVGTFTGMADSALSWGRDLMDNFIGGIHSMWGNLVDTVSGAADTVKRFLGFSEPEEGPLSDFHTYAPDMMALFAQGIRESEHLVTDQIGKSFDFGSRIIPVSGGASREIVLPRSGAMSIGSASMEVDRQTFARLIFRLYNEEAHRVGVAVT